MPQKMNGVTHSSMNAVTTQVTTDITGSVANFTSKKPVSMVAGKTKTPAMRARIAPNDFAARRSRSRRAGGAVRAVRTPTTTGSVTDSTSTLIHDCSNRSPATSSTEWAIL
ncbi:hypothetical protein [Streptomyces coeruleorubidus]|uniref:hypothetical protein n=1 Tax=Streptomyces coeruleorubidus TaxID=116188 RepID=UPI0033B521A7